LLLLGSSGGPGLVVNINVSLAVVVDTIYKRGGSFDNFHAEKGGPIPNAVGGRSELLINVISLFISRILMDEIGIEEKDLRDNH
jgi:hypothetical protein